MSNVFQNHCNITDGMLLGVGGKGWGGWRGGRAAGGRLNFLLGLFGKFQTHAFRVVPSVGPIVSVVTLQDQQNSLQKSRPVNQAW